VSLYDFEKYYFKEYLNRLVFPVYNFGHLILPAAFTLNGFDNQERNLMFMKTNFQVLKLKFYSCNFKHAFHHLHKLHIA